MAKNDINTASDILLDEVEGMVNNLNEDGARALRSRDYEKATGLIEQATRLTDFHDRLRELRREWQTQFAGRAAPPLLPPTRPAWHTIIHQTAQSLLTRSRKDTFTPAQVYHEVLKTYPEFNRGTNNAQILAGCVNCRSRRHYPGRKPDHYYHVEVGVYRLYDPDRDGLWDQEGNPLEPLA